MSRIFTTSKESIILITAALLIILECYLLLTPNPRLHILSVWIYFAFIPIGILYLLGERIGRYGFAKPVWPFSAVWTLAIILPIILYAVLTSLLPEFQEYYDWDVHIGFDLLIFRLILAVLYYLSEEFFFRGFLLFGLRDRVGDQLANSIQAVLFALFHIGKPPIEAFFSLLLGFLFGHVTLRTHSFLPSVFLHWLIGVIGIVLPLLLLR